MGGGPGATAHGVAPRVGGPLQARAFRGPDRAILQQPGSRPHEMTRRTIARDVTLEGTGLHLGVPVRMTFRPAPSGHGIVFRRTDLPGIPEIAARADVAVLTERRTQLGVDPVS